jgi:hypothetical protein
LKLAAQLSLPSMTPSASLSRVPAPGVPCEPELQRTALT